jgi:hypothetical protein
MKNPLLTAGLLIGLALFCGIAVPAQSALKAGPVAVSDVKARAILADGSIRFELLLPGPAVADERVVAWLLSPMDAVSGETTVTLGPGSRSATLSLPWTKEAHSYESQEVGWYRIGYRIEANSAPVAHGILSVGAIATNLLALRLARPTQLVSGKPLSVRVFAGNPVTHESYRGVRLQATLTLDAKDEDSDAETGPAKSRSGKQTLVQTATTGTAGESLLNFPIKPAPGQSASLRVIGTMVGSRRIESSLPGIPSAAAEAIIKVDLETSDRTAIHIEADKPLHKPGEIVHLRALVFDDSGRAAANRALTMTIKDPDNKTLLEAPLTTNIFGIAAYDWKTTQQLATGDYDVDFDVNDSGYGSSSSETIRIQHYELPEFATAVTMDRGYYLDGQVPVAHIRAGYLFGKPVAGGKLRIVRADEHRWNVKTGKFDEPDEVEQSATLDANGDADLHLDVKKDFDDFKDREYQRFNDVLYRAIVTDSTTGRSEPRNFSVRLTRYPVHIYLRELGGNNHEGDYLVSTSYADGVPAACKVTLDWMDGNLYRTSVATVITNQYGLARVHLRFPSNSGNSDDSRTNLRLTARDREGRISTFDDTINAGDENSIWISVAHSLLKPGQPIEATLHGPVGKVLDVETLSEDGVLAHQQVHMRHAEESFTVPASAAFHGLLALQAYSMNSDTQGYQWQRSTGLRPSYLPGAEVDAGLGLHDAAGKPAIGAFGIAVIDTAVEQRAQTEEEANDRWFGVSWWNDESNVGGVTRASLDKTDMSQPVSDDLDLAAEAELESDSSAGIQVEQSNDDDKARGEYETGMERSVKALGVAILAARPVRLPATFDAVEYIRRAAKLDDALVLDPWTTPYKVVTAVEGNDEVVRLESAGPDKRFGTEDDFSIELARRNYFALPGERLSNLIKDAVIADRTLPGTLDELKALARAGGLDLDATLDVDGKPFNYAILVQRRSYSIQVLRQSGATLWTSPSIDYFSHTAARIDTALHAWTEAEKPFPETEAEARQAFTAAGIDVDTLSDPLGQRFQLRSTQVMAYTRVEKVKAGGGDMKAQSKPVTHLMRALQILRPSGTPTGEAAQDVVAQFLHPITEQGGGDLKPQKVDEGTFKGNTGAIGGTATDQTGAVIAGAVVNVKTSDSTLVASGKTLANGTYLIADISPGFYSVQVLARGFESFLLREVYVSSASLTTVDVELRVGSESQTVTVEAEPMTLQTSSASVSSVVSISRGIVGPDGKTIVKGTNGKATISESNFTPRLRHVFEETAYWSPSLATDAHGHANIHFQLPDSLTTWKLHALASTVDGRIHALDQTFQSFQPFFVDLDAPQVLTVGDEITLPVNLRNYLAHNLTLPVTVTLSDWFTLFTSSNVNATVPSNGTTPVLFGLHATKAAEAGPLKITASNEREGDAVEKTVRIHPDGEPRSVTASGLLRSGSTTLALDLPTDAVPGSVHAELLLYPNLGAHILHSMKAVLERPYGCGEQTISSTYPSLLFLELLESGKSTTPLEGKAQSYLQQGYDRLLGYFGAGGGITYWGRNEEAPDPALTAYGIEFLTEAEPYVKVDRSRIVGAINWLVANQQADGSWKPHYGDTSADLNLYVAEVLHRTLASTEIVGSVSKELRERANKSISQAIGWAATSVVAVHDPYANALRLRMASDTTAVSLRSELAQTAQHDREGAHWTRPGYSPFYGWGHAGELETTALVLSALGQRDGSADDRVLVNDTLFYLLRSQDRYGIWYSGQATVRVLQALLPMAIEQMKVTGTTQDFQLVVNGAALSANDAETLLSDSTLIGAPRSLDITSYLKPGRNEFIFGNTSNVVLASTEVTASYYIPWVGSAAPASVKTQTGKDYGLDFGYQCMAENAKVGQPIDCKVDVRRFGSSGYGMLLAEVGLPPGSDVDRASLAKLLDNWTISRYELQPDRIVFYLWSWHAEGSHFSFSFTPRYAIHAKAAPATLIDYYNPDLKSVLAPQTFTVTDSLRR